MVMTIPFSPSNSFPLYLAVVYAVVIVVCNCNKSLSFLRVKKNCLEIWHTEGGYKGSSRYQLWLEYDKQPKRY